MVALIIGVTCGNENERRAVEPPLLVGGLSLVERAVLAAQRAGVDHSVVVGSARPDDAMTGRLRGRGADVTFIDWGALQQLDLSDGALVIRGCVLVDGTEFLGQPTAMTPVVYLTEERESTFRETLKRAGLLDRSDLHVLQWRDTLGETWESIMESAVMKCEEVGARLLVVDTVSQFAQLAGDRENNAGDVLKVYRPLQEAGDRGLAVISIRHERKSGGDVANAGRGSSAFAGAADIVLAIRRPEGNARTTIREIHALSRFDETPDFLAIEFTDDGYVALGDSAAVANVEAKAALLRIAPTSSLREEAGLADVRFHDGRHTALTRLAENGQPDWVIQAQLGHVSPAMMKTYSHVRRKALDEAASVLEPADIASWETGVSDQQPPPDLVVDAVTSQSTSQSDELEAELEEILNVLPEP